MSPLRKGITMAENARKERLIAYRCSTCGSAVLGTVGKFAIVADMLRLKCGCDDPSILDIHITRDEKIKLTVPCILCGESHSFVVSQEILLNRDLSKLSCPYSGVDIAFIGEKEAIDVELERTGRELSAIMAGLEAEDVSELQPQEMNEEEILPDPSVYDTIRFVLKDLEADGQVKCPCGKGGYDLRFSDDGIQAYCESCGATYTFRSVTPAACEEYLTLDSIKLS